MQILADTNVPEESVSALRGDGHEVVYSRDVSQLGPAATDDITEEGLHRDIYRDGEKIRSEEVSPPIPANEGFDAAEEDLRKNVEEFIKRFENGTE